MTVAILNYPFSCQVVGFDGSSTVAEFNTELCRLLGTRSFDQSGFSIHSDDPLEKDLCHALNMEDKVRYLWGCPFVGGSATTHILTAHNQCSLVSRSSLLEFTPLQLLNLLITS